MGCNSFDIVCPSVTTLTAERTSIQTWFLVCRSSGRISRSSSKVKVIGQRSRSLGQKCLEPGWFVGEPTLLARDSIYNYNANKHMKTSILLYLEIIIHSTPYTNSRATTRGVFKAHAFFVLMRSCSFLLPQRCPIRPKKLFTVSGFLTDPGKSFTYGEVQKTNLIWPH